MMRFNFNKVVDLYREWKTDEWCTYLYENIFVFIDWCKSITINTEDRLDIASEAIMEAHKSILKSLHNEYAQIYSYVKTRVIGRIKNYYIQEARALKNYCDLDDENIGECLVSEVDTSASKEVVLRFIIEGILWLSDSEKQVIYLRIFNFPEKTLNEISEISWINKSILSRKYRNAICKIKQHLYSNWLTNEDLL